MKKIMKNKKGITLVALVVTIVVLIILAGASLVLVLGNNGIITKALEAKDKTSQAQENEKRDLASIDKSIEEMLGEFPKTNETMPYLPTGCSKVNGTSLYTGLVMQDVKENQYVWIEVPKNVDVYKTTGITETDFSNDDIYKKIENDLHSYTNTYRNNTEFSDIWYSKDQTGIEENEYNTLKKKMLKSVYQNGGFWIGRYEVGDKKSTEEDTSRTIAFGTTDEATIKEGQHPYDFVSCSQAETLSKTLNPDSSKYNTSLMFGVQWDLIMKYLETKGATQSELGENCKSWGNYYDVEFDITKGKYNAINTSDWSLTTWNNVTDKYTKENAKDILLTTGATDRNKKQEIYDLAGNVWEWTLEYSNDSSNPCTRRGGDDVNIGATNPVTDRGASKTNDSCDRFGFRVTLY